MEENIENQSENTLLKDAVRLGAIIGGANVIITVLFYAIDYTILVTFKMLLLTMALYIGTVIFGGVKYRNSVGGFLSFGKAYQHGLVAMITAGLIGTIFTLILHTLVDPELGQKLTDAIAENVEAMMQKFGAPESEIDKAVDKIKTDSPNDFKPLGQVLTFGKILIFCAIISLITGAIVKKNQPVKF